MDPKELISKTFSFKLGSVDVAPTYWQAALIVLLIFLLVWTFARIRYLYVHWSLGKSSIAFLFWGFLLALVIEGVLIVGGKTMFTEILGWKNAPKPISNALDFGRNKLVDVLGITEEIPESYADEERSYQSVLENYDQLSGKDRKKVQSVICEPQAKILNSNF